MTNPSGPAQPAAGKHGRQQDYPAVGPERSRGHVRKKSPVRRIVFTLVAVAVIAALAIVGRLVTDDPDVAGVGDCMAGASAAELKVVDCTDAAATHKVVGKVDGKSQVDFRAGSAGICKPFPGATRAFWKGTVGGNGYVLCLSHNH